MRLFLLGMLLSVTLVGESQRAVSAFEKGRRYYSAGSYTRALDGFSTAIKYGGKTTLRNQAFYYQGLVLFELGLYYGAYVSFRNVLNTADLKSKAIYEKAIKNSVIIADKLNMTERIGRALAKLPPSLIASSVRAHASYAIGTYYAGKNQTKEAEGHLKSVHPQNPFYTQALFRLGVLATKKRDYREAAFYFNKVRALNMGDLKTRAMAELARLNLARSVYAAGNLEKAIELYSQFSSVSPHWLTILQEASWPLLRVNDTTVSLGNLHTVTSPFYQEDLVGEAYVLRATILFSLCKYEEMRQTLNKFFEIYDPVLRSMQKESNRLGSSESFFVAFEKEQGLNRAFLGYTNRDLGIQKEMKVWNTLRKERLRLIRFGRNEQLKRIAKITEEAIKAKARNIGRDLRVLHRRKLKELRAQREQANYLKVEIITGEKELLEGQQGLPPKRVVDVETDVSSGYHYWPYNGEYWDDELGAYVYTTESSCVN